MGANLWFQQEPLICGRALYMLLFSFILLLPAEVNTINESTEILHLSPAVTTEYVGEKPEKAEFCDRSCEELGSMFTELTGLRIVVNNLADNLQKVVGTYKSGELTEVCSAGLFPSFFCAGAFNRDFCVTYEHLLVYLHLKMSSFHWN